MSDSVESKRSARRPRGVMRERILDVALELFMEDGYEKTSLRDIAERLGVTKAAIYYHFERKEDILLELHLRLHAIGRTALDKLEALDDPVAQAEAWPALMDEFIEQVLANRDLFMLHERNRVAVQVLANNERHLAEQDDIEQQAARLLASPAIPLADRVRMACSMGAVMGALVATSTVFDDVPEGELAALVRDAVRSLTAPLVGR